MAIKRYSGDRFTGLAADTKPTDVEAGALFTETDTDTVYHFDGSSWNEIAYASVSHTHSASQITSGTFADARISQSSVTQHEGALSIAPSQLTQGGATSGQVLQWNGSNWVPANAGAVDSVFGRTGAVTAQSGDYTAAQVDAVSASSGGTFSGTITINAFSRISAGGFTTTSGTEGDSTLVLKSSETAANGALGASLAFNRVSGGNNRFAAITAFQASADADATGLKFYGHSATFADPLEEMAQLTLGGMTIGGNTVWHAGNDGDGSGLSADNLGGVLATNGTRDITFMNGTGERVMVLFTGDRIDLNYATDFPNGVRTYGTLDVDGQLDVASQVTFRASTFVVNATETWSFKRSTVWGEGELSLSHQAGGGTAREFVLYGNSSDTLHLRMHDGEIRFGGTIHDWSLASNGTDAYFSDRLLVGKTGRERSSFFAVNSDDTNNIAEFGEGTNAMFIASNAWGGSAMIGWGVYHNDTGSNNIFNHLYYNEAAGANSAGGAAIGVNNNGAGGFYIYTAPASTGAGTLASMDQKFHIPHSGDISISPNSGHVVQDNGDYIVQNGADQSAQTYFGMTITRATGYLQNATGQLLVRTQTSNPLIFQTNGTQRIEIQSGGNIEISNSSEMFVGRGITGGYGDTTNTGNSWGASIWSIGDSWNGSGTGTSYTLSNNYGLVWLRPTHPNVNEANEGLYLYKAGGLIASLGESRIHFAKDVYFGGNLYFNTTGTSGDYISYATQQGITYYENGGATWRLSGNGENFINGGNLGIGTTTPSNKLHVLVNSQYPVYIQRSGNNGPVGIQFRDNDSNTQSGYLFFDHRDANNPGTYGAKFEMDSTETLGFYVQGDVIADNCIATSDERTKERVGGINNALLALRGIDVHLFKRDGLDKIEAGYFAQNVESYTTGVVVTENRNGYEDFKSMNMMSMQAYNTAAIKELDNAVTSNEQRIKQLEKEIQQLRGE